MDDDDGMAAGNDDNLSIGSIVSQRSFRKSLPLAGTVATAAPPVGRASTSAGPVWIDLSDVSLRLPALSHGALLDRVRIKAGRLDAELTAAAAAVQALPTRPNGGGSDASSSDKENLPGQAARGGGKAWLSRPSDAVAEIARHAHAVGSAAPELWSDLGAASPGMAPTPLATFADVDRAFKRPTPPPPPCAPAQRVALTLTATWRAPSPTPSALRIPANRSILAAVVADA